MPQFTGIWSLTEAQAAVRNQNWPGIAPPSIEYLIVAGGSGIVIIRYPDIYKDAVSTTNGTKTTYTGYKVYTFTSSGSIMF